jgi:putative transport protein
MEQVHAVSPHAEPIMVIAITAIVGLMLGSLQFRGMKLGVAGMLFSGLWMGHLGLKLEPELLAFLKEFGLVLFVVTVGLQLGPGFFNSLKKDGLQLNGLAVLTIGLGALVAYLGGNLLGWRPEILAGIFSGATTNTPSLGAAQQLLLSHELGSQTSVTAAMAYAVVYPFGVVGIILALVILRIILRIDLGKEAQSLTDQHHHAHKEIKRVTWEVENPNIDGVAIRDVPGLGLDGVVISRIRHHGHSQVEGVSGATIIRLGDRLLAIGQTDALARVVLGVGKIVDEDLRKAPGHVVAKRVIVTNKRVIGKSIGALQLQERYNVTISRVSRQDMVLSAMAQVNLQFGDMVNVVGEESAIENVQQLLGNSIHQINETSFASIFVGIALGVLLGLYPWNIPGVPVPLRLGLAAGPLLVAIMMGRMGRIGPLVIHMPINANTAFRELGIIFFLACVGLGAGEKFFATAFSQIGLQWMALGVAVTMIPLIIVGIIGRKFCHLNFLTLSGLLAGSMTDPPALAFANKLSQSDHPSLAYANVYPLTMLLRILIAQMALLWLM